MNTTRLSSTQTTRIHSPRVNRHSGATFLETLLALIPVFVIGSIGIELARAYQIRHILTLGLHEAARVAAVREGDPLYWQPVLHQSLSRIFLPAGRFGSARIRLDAERQQFQKHFGRPLWQAERLHTAPETIHLHLTYLHRPLQAWLHVALAQCYAFAAPRSNSPLKRQSPWRQGLIPIVIEYRVLNHRPRAAQTPDTTRTRTRTLAGTGGTKKEFSGRVFERVGMP